MSLKCRQKEKWPGPRCIKLTINGKLDFNGNYYRILDADWLWCFVAIESKVTIYGKFYATGHWSLLSIDEVRLQDHFGNIFITEFKEIGWRWLHLNEEGLPPPPFNDSMITYGTNVIVTTLHRMKRHVNTLKHLCLTARYLDPRAPVSAGASRLDLTLATNGPWPMCT